MNYSPENVLNELKQGKVAPVYFLHGEESYYIDLISDYIEKNLLSQADKGFNQTVVYGKDVKVRDILNQARRYPMMADRQVVIVKEAQAIYDLSREEGAKLLLQYFKKPVPTTVLVFCHKTKTLDKRKMPGKQLEGSDVVSVVSKKVYDDKLPRWIAAYVAGKGVKINYKATQMLSDAIGADLERLANEIDKVIINLKAGDEIDEVLVQQYVGISKDYNVFELQKALAAKNTVKVMRIVAYLEANPKKNPLISIVAVLFRFYSKLLVALSQNDRSARGIAAALKMNAFFAQDYVAAAGHYSLAQVINAIGSLRRADLQIKGVDSSGSVTEGQLLRELAFRLLV